MAATSGPLPPAVEATYQILAERGPLSAADIREQLRSRGFNQSIERLAQLPDRFPNRFKLTAQGLLSVASSDDSETNAEVDVESDRPDWYRPTTLHRAPFDRIAVLDIETTGLDRQKDFTWEVALVRLDGHVLAHSSVKMPDGVQPPTVDRVEPEVSLDTALRSLETQFAEIDLLLGHNLLAFDKPFLESEAKRAGIEPPRFPPCADSLHLSMLVDVAMPNRSLTDLTGRFDIDRGQPHRALPDAIATAAVIRRLLDSIDIDDPSWQLAIGVLETFDSPLVSLMPGLSSAPELSALTRESDPLLVPSGSMSTDAWSATRDAFPILQTQRGLRSRAAQQEMAHAVAEVFDRGGRLAVEAPTGTGKSLAYLLPAIGRASRPAQPVVVATATKALQAQLRGEAARLQAEGLLRAPFRQVQGVGNYVCARELEDGLPDDDSSGLALAVAIRALATSPTGAWDDVTDDVIRIRDTRYARTRARLRTNSGGCDRMQCSWAHICPLMQQLRGLDKTPGVVSVNHALIASWVKVEQAGGHAPGNVLTQSRADLVFDEAHALEDTLTTAWTERIDALELEILVNSLSPRSRLMRTIGSKARAAFTEARPAVNTASANVRAAGAELAQSVATYLHEYSGQSDSVVLSAGVVNNRPEFRLLRQAASQTRYWLIQLAKAVTTLRRALDDVSGARSAKQRLRGYSERLDTAIELLGTVGDLPDSHLWVYRLAAEEDDPAAWTYDRIPIHVFPEFQQSVVDRTHSTVLCSATLTVQHRFDYIASRLGIRIDPEPDEESFRALTLPSPFDYSKQSIVILTNHLPVPIPENEREFCEEMAADQTGFLSLSGGKALTLFAARTRMEAVAAGVKNHAEELAARGVELLVQNELGRSQILHRFRSEPGTVLYGLRSYWEGFDAPGETLSYLFIEKPPYPHPGDPLVAARQRAIAERGVTRFLITCCR